MDRPQTQDGTRSARLQTLDPTENHRFIAPVKRINEGHDVPAFLMSKAYADIGRFVMQLNVAMCPRKPRAGESVQTWPLDSSIPRAEPVRKLRELLTRIENIIDEAPPDTGPRRFGNVSFRKWYEILEARVKALLQEHLPTNVLHFNCEGEVSVLDELTPYLMGAFGSAQRLDYGTGHELSFLAFLGCIWKLGGFTDIDEGSGVGDVERSIVLGVVEPYLRVVRKLILTYTLEPAGSHGVWGLDDHAFIPYILGSAQYCPAISDGDDMPQEGSLVPSPNPGDIAKRNIVDREREHNMYFAAVGFINDVKTGPFWEHSPILFDISGVRSGWGKINKGMIKMYNAEVLSKFPVVQHFPFGSLFSWEQDPNAVQVSASVHQTSQPASSHAPTPRPPQQESTRAPWANAQSSGVPSTAAPWARTASAGPVSGAPATRAPWATQPPIRHEGATPPDAATRAPWAEKR